MKQVQVKIPQIILMEGVYVEFIEPAIAKLNFPLNMI